MRVSNVQRILYNYYGFIDVCNNTQPLNQVNIDQDTIKRSDIDRSDNSTNFKAQR